VSVQKVSLYSYGNTAKNGEHYAYFVDIKFKVKYPQGYRDLCFFCMTNSSGTPLQTKEGAPQIAVAVCNHTQRKSRKAKINLVARALLRKQHNISSIQSLFQVIDIEDLLWCGIDEETPYKIIVKNKTVGKNTVSNVIHIFSELDNAWHNIEQLFDKKKNK